MRPVNTIITTAIARESERFSFWREIVSDKVIHLDIEPTFPKNPFHGSIKSTRIGALQFASVQSISQFADRSRQQISKSTEDTNVFCFDLSGKQKLSYKNDNNELNPGDWVVLDSALPFKWFFPDDHVQLTLKIPKAKLRTRANLPESNPAYLFLGNKGLGKIVFDTVGSFWNETDNMLGQQMARFEDLIIELLANVLAECIQNKKSTTRSHFLRKIEIKAFIKDHLRNPKLSIDFIADALNISTRYLHFLFEDEDTTIGRYIRELRLGRCKRDLENFMLADRTITEICYYWGFNDSSHFSKLFKSHFGSSPKHYRCEWKEGMRGN